MSHDIHDTTSEEVFWTRRYQEGSTGWNIGYPAPPITEYFDQVDNKNAKILLPGAGNAYEAEYLYRNGFQQVYVLDIARPPLEALKKRFPDFPEAQLLHGNFFEYQGQFDYVVEQTFFCSFPPLPENRRAYAQHVYKLLRSGGKLVGVWFNFPLTGDLHKRPFGGSKAEYLSYFDPLFEVRTFEPCYNSIKPRRGSEWFGIFCRGEG